MRAKQTTIYDMFYVFVLSILLFNLLFFDLLSANVYIASLLIHREIIQLTLEKYELSYGTES